MTDATRERQLLLCCARTRFDAPTRQRIEALLASDLDWDRFLQMALAHQVMPLVGSALSVDFAANCPPMVIERVRVAVRTDALRGLLAAQKLVEVVDLFGAANVPVIPLKGPTLSILAYGHLCLRQFGDLDVWVHPWDYHFSVPGLLAREGWSQASDFGFERSYRSATGDAVLDVHQSLTYPKSMPFSLRFEDALTRCREVSVVGRLMRTLAPMELLVVLCVQLAKDTAEERRAPPLAKVCDIAELMCHHPQLNWHEAVRIARDEGVQHVLCLGVAVAAKLLGIRVPDEIGVLMRKVPDLDCLVRHVEERIFDDGQRRYARPELLDPLTWNAAIRERFRDRNRAMVALMQDVFVPSEPEYALVRLPKPLFALYWVVRPARLAWKYFRLVVGVRPRGTPRQ